MKITLAILTIAVGVVLFQVSSESTTAADQVAVKKKAEATAYAEAYKVRASRRAFYTAPPVIPHDFADGAGLWECMYCHKRVDKFKGEFSKQTPHPQFSNCKQCHVRGTPKDGKKIAVASNWVGLLEPVKIPAANDYMPPVIPHRVELRDNCSSCHNSVRDNKRATSGPHPKRSNCRQCHVASKSNEFLLSK